MALVTVNGLTAYESQRRAPRVGVWAWDLRVESEDDATGAATVVVDDGAATFRGTIVRHQVFAGALQLQVLAGAGGMGTPARPRHYRDATLRVVLADLLRDAGEALSPASDAAVLATAVPRWSTLGEPVGALLGRLVAAVAPGASWRSMDDGTVWVGVPAWPDASVDEATFQVLDAAAEDGSMLLSVDRPGLVRPGTVFQGQRVAMVQDDDPHGGGVTTRVWFEAEGASQAGRDLALFQALVRGTPYRLDRRAKYWARVVSQSGRTVQAVAEDPAIGDLGTFDLVAPAGDRVDGVVGGRVLVGWSGADGTGGYAEAFDGGETVAEKVIDAAQAYLGSKVGAEPAPMGLQLVEYLTAVAAAVNSKPGGSPCPPPPPTMLASRARVA